MERKGRDRPGHRGGNLGRPSGADNGTRRSVRRLAAGAVLAAWAATAGGCSLSFPISGVKTDDMPTGSIDRTASFLPGSLDREDVRRARAAMAVALDPQGNGARAGWRNPQTGAHGGFTAKGSPYADHDRVCRRFSGEVVAAAAVPRAVSGSACREGDGTWQAVGGAA